MIGEKVNCTSLFFSVYDSNYNNIQLGRWSSCGDLVWCGLEDCPPGPARASPRRLLIPSPLLVREDTHKKRFF